MLHRIVLDIDGNAWSERFTRLLCMNSAVVKVLLDPDDQCFDYTSRDLIPNVHYIPASLDNFTEVVRDVMEDGDFLRGVVEKANEWCRREVRVERMNGVFLSVLEGYVSLLEEGWENIVTERQLQIL